MTATVVALIRNEENELLFTVRKHDPASGMLDLPGGFVDLGETAEQAIVREIKEELNLNISKLGFIGTFPNSYLFETVEYSTLNLAFNCTVESFQGLQAADDVSGYVFRDPAHVQHKEIGLESIRNIVTHLLSTDN